MKSNSILLLIAISLSCVFNNNATIVRNIVLKNAKTNQQIFLYSDIHRMIGGAGKYREHDQNQLNYLISKLSNSLASASDLKIFFEGSPASQEELETTYADVGGILIRMRKACNVDKRWQEFATDIDNRQFLNEWVNILPLHEEKLIPLEDLKSFIKAESHFFTEGLRMIERLKASVDEDWPNDFKLLIKQGIIHLLETFEDIYKAAEKLSKRDFNQQLANEFLNKYIFGDLGWQIVEASIEINTLCHIAINSKVKKLAIFAGEDHVLNLADMLSELGYEQISKSPVTIDGKTIDSFDFYDQIASTLGIDGIEFCTRTSPLDNSYFDCLFN